MTKKDVIHISVLCGLFFIGFFGTAHIYGEGVEPVSVMPLIQDTTSTLLFVGDILLARDVERQINTHSDFSFPFQHIASTTRAADFMFGNLEGAMSDRGINQGSIYSFRDDPRTVEGLLFAGFDALSLANNHIFDWGREALRDTVVHLNSAGIKTVGAGGDAVEANAPLLIDAKDAKVALIAFTNLYPKSFEATGTITGISKFDEGEILEKIRALRTTADIVVLSIHWGNEYETSASNEQKRLGRMFIDAGADIVVGHHPHVVQELEQYKNGWIAYSLGNFIFDQNFSDETRTGDMLEVRLKNKRIESVSEKTIMINDEYQPFME